MEDRLITFDENNKILIINTAFLGDIALTAFLTQKIKNEYKCDISVLTTQFGADVLSPIKSIDGLFILDKKGVHKAMSETKEFAKKLSTYGFDTIISLHKSYRTSIIVKNISAFRKIGFSNATNSSVYTTKVKYKWHLHEAKRYLSTCFDDLELENIELDVKLDDKLYIENLLNIDNTKSIVLLAPGSVWETKKWGNQKYYDLADILKEKYNVVIIGSKNDSFETPMGVTNLCGKTSFPQLYHLLSISNLLVTNDSAPTHFASITNTPTITLFGATHPMFGFSPLADKNIIVQNDNLKCRPCRVHGSDICPLGTHECMTSITPDAIANKIELLLNS